MDESLFASALWAPALDKYAEATGLTVELYGVGGEVVLGSVHPSALVALFREYAFEPGLFAECARRCLNEPHARSRVCVDESHGLAVVGSALVLEGTVVGAAVAGYALASFSQVPMVQRWARSAGVPFDRLWHVVRALPPVPERRLKLHGALLQVLGEALLRENYRTRQYEDIAARLQAADAAKDEFLAILSHELRTPLAPIASWASVLKRSRTLEHVQRAAEAIERNARLQSRMIDDLLDVTRIAQGTITLDRGVHELPALVRAAVETSAQEAETKAIRLEVVVAGEPLFVEGDSGRLQQVFRNIVSNAVKFTPVGGSITVTISDDADRAQVVIADTGVGISAEFLPFVFDMFRQQESGTRRAHAGLGIGLALVKRLVELHDGTVSAASAGAGRGAEITVCLPLVRGTPLLRDASAASALSPLVLAGISILVVEDTDDTRESLRALLEVLGARVEVAGDGREALEMIGNAPPDLVLCDLRMPRMDGFEFIRELLRGASPVRPPPVVAVSGLASDADRRRARDAGFEGHIKKPFDEASVVAAVGAALGQRAHR